MEKQDILRLSELISDRKIGILPTDTIYGLVGLALDRRVVENIIDAKGRPAGKAMIILISRPSDVEKFGIKLNEKQEEAVSQLWPGPYSVILDCPDTKFDYLNSGKKSLAFRIPDKSWLRQLISLTGPIVATSANYSGMPTPKNLDEIKDQLPDLDFYVPGQVDITPSKLVLLDRNGQKTYLKRS